MRQVLRAGSSIGAGCLVFALAFVLIPVVALAGYFLLGLAQTNTARRAFPSGVELGNVLHQQSVGGVREGCVLVIFQLSDDAVQSLEANRAAYLDGLGDTTRSGRMLSGWRRTPMWEGRQGPIPLADEPNTISADAAWTCNDQLAERARGPYHAAQLPGSYYATYNRGEGAIMLVPSERVAVFLYFG